MPVEAGRGRRAKNPVREIASAVVDSPDHVRLKLIDIRIRDGISQFKLSDSDGRVAWYELAPGDTIRVTGPTVKQRHGTNSVSVATAPELRRGQLNPSQRFTLQCANGTDHEVLTIERVNQTVQVTAAGPARDSTTQLILQLGDRVRCKPPLRRQVAEPNGTRPATRRPLSISEMVVAQITQAAGESGICNTEASEHQGAGEYGPSKHFRPLQELLTPAPQPPKASFTAALRSGEWIRTAVICLVLAAPIMLSSWHVAKSWVTYNRGVTLSQRQNAGTFISVPLPTSASLPSQDRYSELTMQVDGPAKSPSGS
jgi:hypothetical protein